MPQMAPIWWESLFTLFTMTIIFMNTMIFWIKMYSPKKLNQLNKNFMMNNWKW
uniref:ATP synthase F0 subunit 8 n=1 Tax=Pylorgus porrectus TaxID=3051108 RepID=UPI0025A95751|nr:ATP synthase F0 subunit 8 [Pylorgus porrectus]WIF28476.1 ATP synthase F0 subunit 8 [Pylorgus porrectus]